MNDTEIKRLAHAVNELRPSWPISSLTTFIQRSLGNRIYRDAALALIWVALDVDAAGNYVTKTPKRVLEFGPWWKAAEVAGTANQLNKLPPKRTEECRTHIGQYADNCGGCRSDQIAESDYPEESAMNPTHLTGAAMVRAAMREGGAS